MQTRQIIEQARALATQFSQHERDPVRMPVFSFESWLNVFEQPAGGPALNEFRTQQRRNWYLSHFLRQQGLSCEPVEVQADEFLDWAEESGRSLDDGHQRAHALGEYVNRPQAKSAACRHHGLGEPMPTGKQEMLATITVFGETAEAPEVMSVVLHRPDGQVLRSLEILAIDYSPDQAWQKAMALLDQYEPDKVFHDKQIRRPEFCPACNALLVNVASPLEMV
ncbi:MAG: hypothetical protein PVG03_14845 [Desulfarculaceae bacterium]